jgi:hypothetical protein
MKLKTPVAIACILLALTATGFTKKQTNRKPPPGYAEIHFLTWSNPHPTPDLHWAAWYNGKKFVQANSANWTDWTEADFIAYLDTNGNKMFAKVNDKIWLFSTDSNGPYTQTGDAITFLDWDGKPQSVTRSALTPDRNKKH